MEQRVWSIQLGRIYRPVFEAEEMLIKSLKKNQKQVLPAVGVSSSQGSLELSGPDSEDNSDDQLVFNLPDRLPALHKSEKSERLRNLEDRRKERHEKIVEKLADSIGKEIQKFHGNFAEKSKTLKCHLDQHKRQIDSYIAAFDDPDELTSLSESDFDSTWEMIQRQIKDSQSSINAFRDDCIALESSLIQSTGDILESTLSA